MAVNTDLSYVITTEEYADDLAHLTQILTRSLTDDLIADNDGTFVFLVAHLLSVFRYFARHLPDVVDFDQTPFLAQMQQEIGVDLPLTDGIPLIEFLRENKAWFGHKGARNLYNFIGAIVGSRIDVHYPKDLIFRLSYPRTCLSGASGSGPLPWDQSKLGRIRDGIEWSKYTYILDVLDAQNVKNWTDFENLVRSVHPAGEKRFVVARNNYFVGAGTLSTPIGFSINRVSNYFMRTAWPTLDNNWILSGRKAKLSMHGGDISLMFVDVQQIQKLYIVPSYRTLFTDTVMHRYLMDVGPHAAFSRFISKGDGTYEEVFSDTDPIVYENVTTNVGVGTYKWGDVKNLKVKEIRNAAINLDGKNTKGTFMPDLPFAQVSSS